MHISSDVSAGRSAHRRPRWPTRVGPAASRTVASRTVASRTVARLGLLAVLAFAGGSAAPGPLAAQAGTAGPSPYVPLDDAAYGFVDALQVRGFLRDLPVLERPYTVSRLRQSLAVLDTTVLGRVPRTWVRRLARAIAKYDDGRGAWDRRSEQPAARGEPLAPDDWRAMSLHVNAGAMGTAQTSGIRELMLADTALGAHPGVNIRAFLGSGPLVAAFRFRGDQALTADPEYAGFEGGLPGSQRGGPGIAGRAEEAYVSLQLPLVELFGGRVSRNWGPPAYDGLLLGRAAWSYDHVLAKLGNDRLRFTWLTARLTDFGPTSRWFTARRAAARLWGVEFGFSESVLYSGAGRQLEWGLSSPFIPALNGMYNDNEGANLNLAFDLAAPTRAGLFTVQSFVDDVQLDGTTPKPPMYGVTFVADGLRLAGDHRWFASYTEVSNLVYRNTTPSDVYTQQYVSLGRGFTDHREARVGLDLALFADATLRPYAAARWQGTGTYRNPFPPAADWPLLRDILQPPVMTVARLGVQSTWVTRAGLEVSADLGVNRVITVNYIPGTSRTAPEGRVRVQWEPGVLGWRWKLGADDR